ECPVIERRRGLKMLPEGLIPGSVSLIVKHFESCEMVLDCLIFSIYFIATEIERTQVMVCSIG
ncbi:MAG: hypothetical protein RIB86_07325, partial [Imperialibacter sp.]